MNTRNLRRLLLLAGSATLAACTVGPEFVRPAPPQEDRYTANGLNGERESGAPTASGERPEARVQHVELGKEVEGNWWTLFHSETIDGIVAAAIARNRTLVAAQATLQEAAEAASAVAGTRAPQLSLTAGTGREKYGDEFLGGFAVIPPFSYYAIGPALSYTLDYTGGLSRAVERQRALTEYARDQLAAAYLTVTGQAVQQALRIASNRAQIATLETILRQDADNLKLVEQSFAEGSVPRADVVSARSQVASDLTLLPPLRQDLARARHALAAVLGRFPTAAAPPDLDLVQVTLPTELPVSLPSELVHRRPDILAAEAQLHAATSAVGIADSNLYPKIQLTATDGQQSLVPGQLFNGASNAWGLIAGLTTPVFDGGTLRADKRAAEAAMHASAANYEQTVLVAFGQVADALEALDHDAEQLDAQIRADDAAQSNLDLARLGYKEGNTGILTVLDAERQYQQSRLGYVRAIAQRYVDTVQLFLALGGANLEPTVRAVAR
jgi:NodT family efflux transporter outer membrane factor (OMF) lipoprotein